MSNVSAEDDEPDYMSDDFLARCIPEDIRPGLKRSHKNQREHDLHNKKNELVGKERENKKFRIPRNIKEVQNREEGLHRSIDCTNKGFEMLKKMGYKEGEGLGKSNTGRVEPIPIEVKTNRSGLGREEAKKKLLETKSKIRQKHLDENNATREIRDQVSAQEFRNQLSRQHKSRLTENDLYRSQKACCQLDQSKGFTEPVEAWFWPDANDNNDDDDGSDDEHDEQSEKESGSEEDEEESLVDIPKQEVPAKIFKIKEIKLKKNELCGEFLPEEQLQMITEYLRSQYLYCLWCGITFSDSKDMCSTCPGFTREDHDE